MKMAEKRNPALVELVLVILFFALSSVVLVQVFVKAHLISEEAAYEIRAELWTEEKEAGELYHIRVLVTGIRDGKTQVELETARYAAGI